LTTLAEKCGSISGNWLKQTTLENPSDTHRFAGVRLILSAFSIVFGDGVEAKNKENWGKNWGKLLSGMAMTFDAATGAEKVIPANKGEFGGGVAGAIIGALNQQLNTCAFHFKKAGELMYVGERGNAGRASEAFEHPQGGAWTFEHPEGGLFVISIDMWAPDKTPIFRCENGAASCWDL